MSSCYFILPAFRISLRKFQANHICVRNIFQIYHPFEKLWETGKLPIYLLFEKNSEPPLNYSMHFETNRKRILEKPRGCKLFTLLHFDATRLYFLIQSRASIPAIEADLYFISAEGLAKMKGALSPGAEGHTMINVSLASSNVLKTSSLLDTYLVESTVPQSVANS